MSAAAPTPSSERSQYSHPAHVRRTKPLTEAEIKARADHVANHEHSDKSVAFHGMAALDEGAPLVPYQYHPRPLGANDVQIAISHCGICGSDLHQLESGWGESSFPMIPGHEIIGVVKAVGKSVSTLKIGDRVGVGAQVLSCLHCHGCKKGLEQYCENDCVFTYNSAYDDGQYAFGGYQENVRVHEQFAIKVPDALPSAAAAPLLCAGATVWSPLKTYYREGMVVGVAGIGGLGHIALLLAAGLGAKDVVAISTSSRKKDDATKMGATGFVDLSDKESAKKWYKKIDLMIVTANSDDMSLNGWLKFGNFDSRLVLVGLPNTPISFKAFEMVPRRISITGSSIGSPSEIKELFDFCVQKNLLPWVETFPLTKTNEALDKMRAGKAHYRIVLEIGK